MQHQSHFVYIGAYLKFFGDGSGVSHPTAFGVTTLALVHSFHGPKRGHWTEAFSDGYAGGQNIAKNVRF
jgi:hypothetical protein